MPIEDFIISSLNLTEQQIQSLDTVRSDSTILKVFLTLKPVSTSCPYCGGKLVSKGLKEQKLRTLDSAGYETIIYWRRRRYICKDCRHTLMESNPFGPEGLNITFSALYKIVLDLHNIRLSIKEIASRYHVSSTTIERYADSFIQVPRLFLPDNLGIDEIHSDMAKYGGSYLCVFVDNHNRSLTEILPNRSKRTLVSYFDKIPETERNSVNYVTIDMWEPYRDVAARYLKHAVIAVDPFHVIKHLSDGFTKLRIRIMDAQPRESAGYYLLKSWHKLMESSSYNLDNEPKYNSFFRKKINYREILELLLKIDQNLTTAYYLKEYYRKFNAEATADNCAHWFDCVLSQFLAADLWCYRDFVETIKNWKAEILSSFLRPYDNRKQSNALAENINGQLRTLIDVSNGLSNFDRFRARAIYSLNNTITYTITNKLVSKKRTGKKRGNYIK